MGDWRLANFHTRAGMGSKGFESDPTPSLMSGTKDPPSLSFSEQSDAFVCKTGS